MNVYLMEGGRAGDVKPFTSWPRPYFRCGHCLITFYFVVSSANSERKIKKETKFDLCLIISCQHFFAERMLSFLS